MSGQAKFSLIARRHSSAVGNGDNEISQKDESFGRPNTRRNSLADNLGSITRSMSATLSLLQRRTSSLDFGELPHPVDKNMIQGAVCRHYQDHTIKVSLS